jgi:hypothetical protein
MEAPMYKALIIFALSFSISPAMPMMPGVAIITNGVVFEINKKPLSMTCFWGLLILSNNNKSRFSENPKVEQRKKNKKTMFLIFD